MMTINTYKKNSFFKNSPHNMTLKMIQIIRKVHKLEWLLHLMKQDQELKQPLFQFLIKDKKYPQ